VRLVGFSIRIRQNARSPECQIRHWWSIKNSRRETKEATLMYARTENPLWHSDDRSVCSKRWNI